TSCARLGARYGLSRLIHGFTCVNAYCGPDRVEFVFVEPGSVSFTLRRPRAPDGPLPVRLVFQVLPASVEKRTNNVFLNGQLLGLMDAAHLKPPNVFSFDVPPEAERPEDAWTVSVAPGDDPVKAGWDVSWAGLEVVDGTDAGAAGC